MKLFFLAIRRKLELRIIKNNVDFITGFRNCSGMSKIGGGRGDQSRTDEQD